ncbi:hypothetical protein [Streptomyces sp. NPDC001507]|uniref:hypothetical protein n=1 Tax=Streptomyces sp. NPDC001507 TaxID=3364579 RepID=UPI0036AF8DC2
MTRIAAPISAFTRPRRTLGAAALAALALTGCGGNGASGSGPQGEPGAGAGTQVSATQLTPEQAAFAAMLDKVARPCSSTTGSTSGPTDKKPTGPEGEPSLGPGETPPAQPVEPGAPTEAPLDDRDQCASVQHEQRIIRALQAVPEPDPAKVRESLNSLGYISERIHDLKQDGKVTRFYLDLRQEGSRLCEVGTAAGEESDVTPCVAPATGSFAVRKLSPDGS